jgi:hypothetical protein
MSLLSIPCIRIPDFASHEVLLAGVKLPFDSIHAISLASLLYALKIEARAWTSRRSIQYIRGSSRVVHTDYPLSTYLLA